MNKKNFNIVLAFGFLLAVCTMFSSCLVVLDEDALDALEISIDSDYYDYSKIVVQNGCTKYGSDAAYISEVYCKANSGDEWSLMWSADNYENPLYADSSCKFSLNTGRYYFCVRVIYPNLSSKYDYYEDYFTEGRYACAENSTVHLYFDGESLYKK